MSNILELEVLEQPTDALIGLKWKETRAFCGKESSEVMWITEAVENAYYCTRAESHGSVYLSRLSLEESAGTTTLTMAFSGEAQTLVARFFSALMTPFVIKSLRKELQKDLTDVKHHVEGIQGE